MTHRPFEIGKVVSADAGILVRRDVGRIDDADRRFHRQTAGEGLAAGGGVARHAIRRLRDSAPLFDQGRIGEIHGNILPRREQGRQDEGAADRDRQRNRHSGDAKLEKFHDRHSDPHSDPHAPLSAKMMTFEKLAKRTGFEARAGAEAGGDA